MKLKLNNFEQPIVLFDLIDLIMLKAEIAVKEKRIHPSKLKALKKMWEEPMIRGTPALKNLKPIAKKERPFTIQIRQAIPLRKGFPKKLVSMKELSDIFYTNEKSGKTPFFKSRIEMEKSNATSYHVSKTYYEDLLKKLLKKWLTTFNALNILDDLDIVTFR